MTQARELKRCPNQEPLYSAIANNKPDLDPQIEAKLVEILNSDAKTKVATCVKLTQIKLIKTEHL